MPTSLRPRFERCLYESRHWRFDLGAIADILEIATVVLLPLVRQARLGASEAGRRISVLRAAGLYLPGGSRAQRTVTEIVRGAGFPYGAPADNCGGLVVLDIESLVAEAAGAPVAVIQQLLTSLLIHEHAHAIYQEGITPRQPEFVGIPDSVNASPVNESLAEWAELNFFRDNPSVLKGILAHAGGGRFPEWPYAGAIRVEQRYAKSGLRAFRLILNSLRRDPDAAMRSLV